MFVPKADHFVLHRVAYLPTPAQTAMRQLPAEHRFLVGVSGGRDSVTLLDWLFQAGYRNLVVCRLNHQLRGRASDADARFVGNLAAKLELDIVIGRTDVKKLAARKKLS